MVQIIENWTDLHGRILHVGPCAPSPEFILITMAVESTSPVAGFADLLASRAGATVTIRARQQNAGSFQLNLQKTVRTRLAAGGLLFAHPDAR